AVAGVVTRGRPGQLAPRRLQALLERLGEVDDARRLLRPRRRDLLALHLLLDRLQHHLAVGVAIARGLPVGSQRADELQREVHLALVPAPAGRRQLERVGRAYLVGEAQRREQQRRPDRLERGEVLALAQHDRADADAAGAGQRVAQQRVRLAGGLAGGRQIVRLIEVEI